MRPLRLIVGAGSLALATASGALALLALLGRVSHRLDAISHLAPLLLAGALAAALLALAADRPFRRPALAAAAIAALACAAMMAPEAWRATGPKAAADTPGQVKVIAFNAWSGNRDLEAVVAWLKAEDPDFVMVEEITPRLRDLIRLRTGWSVAGYASDTMIFSRKPYLVMNRPLAPDGSGTHWVNATYDNPGGPIEVVVARAG